MEDIDLQTTTRIHMVGIGGIGMSALAQYLVSCGKTVSGSDRSASPTTEMLEEKGISVSIGQSADFIPTETELLIYSDAILNDDKERVYAKEQGIPQISYFMGLGLVTNGKKTIAIGGTHGKTTTTGMLAKILLDAGLKPTVFVGSIMRDFGSNFVPGNDELFIVEACEYKDHILELDPEILVITNVEHDHTDFFPTFEAFQNTFRKAIERVSSTGTIITDSTNPAIKPILGSATAKTIDYAKEVVPELQLIGEFNRMNARAAKAAAKIIVEDEAVINESLSNFQGTWRRFEYKGKTKQGIPVYDDYAHHPTAIAETIQGAHERFPDQKIIVAFHPHLYSRTKAHFSEFAEALRIADEAYIIPIYAAREALDPTISHTKLAEAAGGKAMAVDSFEAMTAILEKKSDSSAIIITMGAGEIYRIAEALTE